MLNGCFNRQMLLLGYFNYPTLSIHLNCCINYKMSHLTEHYPVITFYRQLINQVSHQEWIAGLIFESEHLFFLTFSVHWVLENWLNKEGKQFEPGRWQEFCFGLLQVFGERTVSRPEAEARFQMYDGEEELSWRGCFFLCNRWCEHVPPDPLSKPGEGERKSTICFCFHWIKLILLSK